jgi:tRNA (cytosine34-C5)-methyltransferase
MAKKKKSVNKGRLNPLSDARRVQAKEVAEADLTLDERKTNCNEKSVNQNDEEMSITKSTTSDDGHAKPTSKADLKAIELWHKKSGTGYNYFVQYYASQPMGVVTDEAITLNDNMKRKKISESTAIGKGQSRAAKRRRKKNQNMSSCPPQEPTNDFDTDADRTKVVSKADKTHKEISEKSFQYLRIESELKDAMEQIKESRHLATFLDTLSTELPLTFRIRKQNDNIIGSKKKKHEEVLKQILNKDFNHLVCPVDYDLTKSIYQALPEVKLTKGTLGKISIELKSLIVDSTSSGFVARQELGSTLPVIALEGGNYLKPGSKVLDMCSSPGSKTLQALEIITQKVSGKHTKMGRIVANDIHPLRIESLKDAISRSGIPNTFTDRIIFTNHDASIFPTPKSGKLFDCIIADVPCSGDGTIRKDPRILSGWMPSISNSLHSLQKKILKRALRLIKIGGVVAYSTCSLNPIEDEAVVASVLSWANRNGDASESKFKVELVEWPTHTLQSMKRGRGVSQWQVAHNVEENDNKREENLVDEVSRLKWYQCFEDADKDRMPHAVPSMWPPPEQQIDWLNLDRCVRLRPQDNNTGGFFVALFKRLS